MFNRIAVLLAASLALGASPAAAANTFGPIQIRSCTVTGRDHRVAGNGLRIVWKNLKPVPASRITFRVTYNTVTQLVNDHGTFSQNALIDRTYNVFQGIAYNGPATQVCNVKQVNFADGSVVAPAP